MSYTKTNWQNLPNQTTPVNATNLNKIEQGIYDNDQAIQTKATLEDIQDNLVNVSNEVDEDYRVNVLKSNNLFNKDNIDGYVGLNATLTTTSNGVRATATTTGQYLQAIVIIKDATNMVGESVSIKGNFTASSSNTGRITIGLCDSAGGNRNGLVHITTSGNSGNATIPSISGDAKYLFIAFYANNDGTGATNSYVDYTNVMLNLGSTALPYEVFIPNQIVVDNEKYSDTINVGSVVDSRNRVNVLKGEQLYNSSNVEIGKTWQGNANNNRARLVLPISPNETYNIRVKGSGVELVVVETTETPTSSSTSNATYTPTINTQLTEKAKSTTTYVTLQLDAGTTFTTAILNSLEISIYYGTCSIVVDNEEIYNKNMLKWKEIGTKQGGDSVNIPNDANEILAMVKVNNNNVVFLSIQIPYETLISTDRGFSNGYYKDTNTNAQARVIANSTTAKLDVCYLNGTNVLSNSYTIWYYR